MDSRPNTGPVFLTPKRAAQALRLAIPSILALMDSVTTHKLIHIVVLGPDGAIAHEESVGSDVREGDEFLTTCREIARSKAQIHFREGRKSREIQERCPHLLLVGDTVHGGSADYEGLVVAASGVQSHFDETIAAVVASICWGLCKDAQEAFMKCRGKQHRYETREAGD